MKVSGFLKGFIMGVAVVGMLLLAVFITLCIWLKEMYKNKKSSIWEIWS